jgi:sodium transport system ATP-binding protein
VVYSIGVVDAVEIESLAKIFRSRKGEVRAVDGISLAVPRGSVYGLLGPNGAGKTTTLRLLATILRPTSGRASIEGTDLASRPQEVRRKIGYLSADTGLYGRLTPREMVTYYGRLNGMEPAAVKARCEELFRTLGVTEYADRPNDKLSSGMKQKVSIARAVVHDPPLLILDEPTSALDVLGAQSIYELIRRARSSGKTVLLSSHNMLLAQRLCDAMAIIHRGRILARGTMADLRAQSGLDDLEQIFLRLVGDVAA